MSWSPYAQPKKQESNNQPAIILLIVFCLLFFISFQFVKQSRIVKPDNDKVIVIDDERQQINLKDSYVVRLYETEAADQKAWLVKLLDDDSFWIDWFQSQEMRYFTLDPESQPDQSESFLKAASKKNIKPPFWMHVAKGGDVLSVSPLTESTTVEQIKSTIERKQ